MSAAFFSHPEWLGPLAALWLAAGLALAAARLVAARRRRRLGAGIPASRPAMRSDLALWLALGALALALAGPRIGTRLVRMPASGVDVVFALDVSRSMDAADVPPSRIARARRAIAELLARLDPADRFALAAFAGRGVLLTPLTPDRDALVPLLDGLDTSLVAPASSHLDAGVRAALGAFEAGSERPRVVFVLSDGEDPERRGDLGGAEAARQDVRVLAAGFGTEVGSTLDDHGVPLLDDSSRPVVSRRDLERLERLAAATDGRVFAADAWGEIDLDAAAAAIRRDAGSRGSAREAWVLRRVRATWVAPLAALAFALLGLEGLPRPRRLARLRRPAPALAGAALALVAATPAPAGDPQAGDLAELESEVRDEPGDPRALIELGIARLERGQRDAAARAFLAAVFSARTPEEAATAYFDLGVAGLERSDYEGARDAFLDALAVDPRDAQARFDLEWTQQALAQHPAPATRPEAPEEQPKPAPPPPKAPPEKAREQAAPPAAAPSVPPPLGDDEQRRWLERVRDDPSAALRSALGGAPASGRRAGGPVW